MIIKGGSRKSGGFFAHHLLKTEENERVSVAEMRGLISDTVPEAFQEMQIVAAGTRAENYFYHASINPREDERLTPEQWNIAVDRLEQNLGLAGHARFQVEHEKEGRTHRHIVWSRVDPDTMTVTPDSNNYVAHDKTRVELEREFSHEPTAPTPQPSQRKSREVADWENFRAAESGIDPKEMKAEITALWQQSDSGKAFQAAIEEQGYLLAKGDRREWVLIDSTGDVHSIARRIEGAKTPDIRAKFSDLDRDSFMTVQQASAWMKGKEEAESSGSSDARVLPDEQAQAVVAESFHNPKFTVLEKYAQTHPPILSEETRALLPSDHPLLAAPMEYVPAHSVQEFADHFTRLYTSAEWQERQPDPALRRTAWDAEQARIAEIDQREPERTSEQGKRRDESWLEFVTHQQQERDTRQLPDPTTHEPELER